MEAQYNGSSEVAVTTKRSQFSTKTEYLKRQKEDKTVIFQKIKAIAKEKGVKAGSMNEVELIRAIQRAEGNRVCYRTEYIKECGQTGCLWREDCLKQV